MGDTNMAGIKILSTGHAVLENAVSNDELAKTVDTSDEWISTRTGIKSRFYADEDTTEIAYKACVNALKGIDTSKIRYLIVATLSADQHMPNVSANLQSKLGLSENMLAFDLNAACSGFLYGLQAASGLLQDGEYALVVGAEKLSKYLDFSDRSTCVLFGDGAGACVLEKSDAPFYRYAQVHSDVDHYLFLKDYVHMNGREVFRFAVSAMQRSIENVIEQANLDIDSIDMVMSHQANIRIIDYVAKKMHIPSSKMYTNVDTYGNTSAASIAIALSCANQEGLLKRGMRLVLVGFGGGLTNGAIYLEW